FSYLFRHESCRAINFLSHSRSCFFFFSATSSPYIYTLSLHDALPISRTHHDCGFDRQAAPGNTADPYRHEPEDLLGRDSHRSDADRKSTRLNSSHVSISYAVFCLKKKKKNNNDTRQKQNYSLIPIEAY